MDEGRQLSLFDEASFFESVDLEFKSGKGGLPGSLWETYSAFANTNGGTIMIGIVEMPDQGLQLQGVSDPQKLIDNLWSTLHNRGKVSVNLLNQDSVSIVRLQGDKDVIRIVVPRANRSQRPVYLNNRPFEETYRRDHTGDYRCTPDEVRRMFADQSTEAADSRILLNFSFDDLDGLSLSQYRNRMASSNPTHPWLVEDDLGLLKKLGGWRKDRATGIEGLTVAGLLMFGRQEAIRDTGATPQYHLDYREHLGDEPKERWSDRLTIDGTWEANLFQFYSRVMPKIAATLKSPFQLDNDLYRYDETSVAAGLREAVVNALIHADYNGQGGVVIDRWSDRIE